MSEFEYNNRENLENMRLLSDLERYEIFNLDAVEKYDSNQSLDFIVDDEGNLVYLVAGANGGKLSLFGGSKEVLEIPWDCVDKIGANIILVYADNSRINRERV
ncbi:MAG: YlmC/YmxH family sporulation protein [Clostridium sp.]